MWRVDEMQVVDGQQEATFAGALLERAPDGDDELGLVRAHVPAGWQQVRQRGERHRLRGKRPLYAVHRSAADLGIGAHQCEQVRLARPLRAGEHNAPAAQAGADPPNECGAGKRLRE